MKPWTPNGPTAFDSAANYGGEDLRHMLVLGVSRTRDSNTLDRSNFHIALERLGGESETVQVHRFGHWAIGWYELILIDPSDMIARETGDIIEHQLENYPSLDEDHFSELEYTEVCARWESMRVADRLTLCQRFHVSPFAARHAYMPSDDNGALYAYLRGD